MCGIFIVFNKLGFVKDQYVKGDLLQNTTATEYVDILLKNAKLMKHRGETDNYRIINNKLLFYHNRLSINDLSKSGDQPLFNKLIAISVNG